MRYLLPRFVLLSIMNGANAADLPAELSLSEALNIALSNSTVLRVAMAHLDQVTGQYQ